MSSATKSFSEQLRFAGRIARRTLSYWWLVVLLGGGGSAAVYGLLSLRTSYYESETVIMHRDVIPDDLVRSASGQSSSSRYMHARFGELLRARPLLAPIIEEQGLFRKVLAKEGMEAAIEEIRERIKLRSSGGGMFKISYRGTSPEKTQKVTKRLADSLIAWELRLQLESVGVARDFLAGERARLAEELAVREREMAQFLAAHPEFAKEIQLASAGTGASIRARNLDVTDIPPATPVNPLADLQRRHARLVARLNGQAAPAPRARTPEQVRANKALLRTRRERDRRANKLAELRSRFTDRHPDVRMARARLRAAERDVQQSQSAVKLANAALRDDNTDNLNKKQLRQEIARVEQLIASQRQRQTAKQARQRGGLVSLETEWGRLLRDFRATKERYGWIESKAFSADMAASSEVARQGTQLTIVNPANLPTKPAGMPAWMLLAAGVALSVGVGIGCALLLAVLVEQYRMSASPHNEPSKTAIPLELCGHRLERRQTAR